MFFQRGLWGLIFCLSVLLTGCGSSQADYFFPGGNTDTPNATSEVVFQFARAQASQVPQATSNLDIKFFSADGTLVHSVTVGFLSTVRVDRVPVSATRVEVKAQTSDGTPLSVFAVSDLVLIPGGSVFVELGAGVQVTPVSIAVTPSPLNLNLTGSNTSAQLQVIVTYSNGDVRPLGGQVPGVLEFTSRDSSIATVTNNGSAQAIGPGTTTFDVSYGSYTAGGQSRRTTVVVTVAQSSQPPQQAGRLETNFTSLSLSTTGAPSAPLTAVYYPAGSIQGEDVSDVVDVTFDNFSPSGADASNFAYNGVTRRFSSANGAAEGSSARVTVSYEAGGETFSATFTAAVIAPNVESVEVVSLVTPGLRAPRGTAYPIVIVETLDDGTERAGLFGSLPGQYSLTADNAQLVSFHYSSTEHEYGLMRFTEFSLGQAEASANVSVVVNLPGGGTSAVRTIPITVVDVIGTIVRLQAAPEDLTLAVGETISYRAVAYYNDNTTQDITPLVGVSTDNQRVEIGVHPLFPVYPYRVITTGSATALGAGTERLDVWVLEYDLSFFAFTTGDSILRQLDLIITD